MYDLVFGYRDGDRGQPAFSAGLGVFLAIRMFLDYKGSLFLEDDGGHGATSSSRRSTRCSCVVAYTSATSTTWGP